MLDQSVVGEISVLSVHDEEDPIHFSIPSVVPSRYDIPGINAPKEVFEACRFSFPGQKPIRYALRRTKDNHPYVLIKIVEPKTFIYGTEQQKVDEYGQRLQPDVMRVPVPVRLEAMANEMERLYGNMGLKAIKGEVQIEDVLAMEKVNTEFLRKRVQLTNVWAPKNPLNVTPQARRSAWILHKKGLLTPLPTWAQIDPNADSSASTMFNCVNCQALLRKDAIKCTTPGCGVIYNWKAAVENGLVPLSEVPPSKRAEAGLLEGTAVLVPAAKPLSKADKAALYAGVDTAIETADEAPEIEQNDDFSEEDNFEDTVDVDQPDDELDGDAAVSAATLRRKAAEMSKE